MTKAESKAALAIGVSLLGIPAIGAALFARRLEDGILALLALVLIAPLALILIVVAGIQLFLLSHPDWVDAARRQILTDTNKVDTAREQLRAYLTRVIGRKEPKEDERVPFLLPDRSVWDQIGRGLFSEHHDVSERTMRIIWMFFFVFVVTPVVLVFLALNGSLEGFGETIESILMWLF